MWVESGQHCELKIYAKSCEDINSLLSHFICLLSCSLKHVAEGKCFLNFNFPRRLQIVGYRSLLAAFDASRFWQFSGFLCSVEKNRQLLDFFRLFKCYRMR
jgi:hypothetical protein